MQYNGIRKHAMLGIANVMHVFAAILFVIALGCFTSDSSAWEGDKRAPWVGTMLNGTKCDGGQVPFGPYDYLQRNSLPAQLEVVEESHFNEDVENLVKGMSASAMGDIHYTLQTWPNHHRALNSAFRFRMQHRELWGAGDNTAQNYPAECYLQRAIQFSPNDPIPYMLHGMLMHQMKQFEPALQSYRHAVRLRPDDLITQYNMGLTLVELKRYGEAQQVADKVYAADFPLPGLQRKLAVVKQQKATAQKPLAKKVTANAVPIKAVEGTANSSDARDSKALPGGAPPATVEGKETAAQQAQKSPEDAPVQKPEIEDKARVAAEKGAATQAVTAAKSSAATPAKLTPDQLAILKQALTEQAEKKKKDAATAKP